MGVSVEFSKYEKRENEKCCGNANRKQEAWERYYTCNLQLLTLIVQRVDDVILRSHYYPAGERASVIRNNYVIHGIAIHSVDSVRYSQNNSALVYKHQFEIGSVCDIFWLFSAYSGSIHSRIPNPSVKTALKLALGINLCMDLFESLEFFS